MPKNYKLSICIPTYNREKYLPELLDSILMQQDAHLVEVAISDNASTDNTEALIKNYQQRFANIVYLKLPENLGPDRNYFKSVEIASGDYVWLMGSDDKLGDGAIAQLLHAIESKKDIYLQDRVECDINMKVKARRSWWEKGTKADWDFSKDNLEEYFNCCNSLGGVFSYLSSIVVKRDRWNSFIAPDEFYITAYSHVFTLLSVIKDNGTLCLINNSSVYCRGGNDHFVKDGWCNRVLIDFVGYLKLEKYLGINNLIAILKKEHGIKGVSGLYEGCIPNKHARKYMLVVGFSVLDVLFVKIRSMLKKIKNTSNGHIR